LVSFRSLDSGFRGDDAWALMTRGDDACALMTRGDDAWALMNRGNDAWALMNRGDNAWALMKSHEILSMVVCLLHHRTVPNVLPQLQVVA
jgi:hypothetical protein